MSFTYLQINTFEYYLVKKDDFLTIFKSFIFSRILHFFFFFGRKRVLSVLNINKNKGNGLVCDLYLIKCPTCCNNVYCLLIRAYATFIISIILLTGGIGKLSPP